MHNTNYEGTEALGFQTVPELHLVINKRCQRQYTEHAAESCKQLHTCNLIHENMLGSIRKVNHHLFFDLLRVLKLHAGVWRSVLVKLRCLV